MLTSLQLSTLASIGKLASSDIHPRNLYLTPTAKGLSGAYHGAYMGGVIDVICDSPITSGIALDAVRFLELAKLFPDNGADLTISNNTLFIREGGFVIKLQSYGGISEADVRPAIEGEVVIVRLNGDLLKDEINIASNFCSRNTTVPILGGIRIEVLPDGKTMRLRAADEYSLYQHSLPCDGDGTALDVTLTGKDVALALTTLIEALEEAQDHTVTMKFIQQDGEILKIIFETANGEMQMSPFMGKWPSVEQYVNISIPSATFTLTEQTLARILTGAKVFDSPRDILLVNKDGHIECSTEGEIGGASIVIDGQLPVAVLPIAKLSLQHATIVSKTPMLYVPNDETTPILFTDGAQRRYWVSRRAVPKIGSNVNA
jgi:hypothetical protein